jgi:hypothetical protein
MSDVNTSEPKTVTMGRKTLIGGAVALVGLAAAVGGTASWAAGRSFTDVPPSHPFYDEITWAEDQGVVNGYPDGSFKPGNTVTRQAAAAFLGNYNDAIYVQVSEVNPASSSNFSHQTECDANDRAVAGGGRTDISNLFITDSHPDQTDASGWSVRWESDDNAALDPGYVRVWALCIPDQLPD